MNVNRGDGERGRSVRGRVGISGVASGQSEKRIYRLL